MEVNRVDEVLFVAVTPGRVLHPLDLGVDGFASRIGDAVFEVRNIRSQDGLSWLRHGCGQSD